MLVAVSAVLLSSWSKYIAPILEPLVAWTPINTLFRRDYGAKVLGFDLSVNMIDIAQERLGPFSNISKIRFIALLLVVLKLFSIFLKIRLSKTWYGSWCEIRSSRRNPNWISKRNFWCHLLKVIHNLWVMKTVSAVHCHCFVPGSCSFPPDKTGKIGFTSNRWINPMLFLRDTILHIEDKETLFANFLKWLKPGGKLMISGGFHNWFWFVDKVLGHIWLVDIKLEPILLWNHSQIIAAHQMNGHLTMLHMLNREGTISTLLPTMVSYDFDREWPTSCLTWPHLTFDNHVLNFYIFFRKNNRKSWFWKRPGHR